MRSFLSIIALFASVNGEAMQYFGYDAISNPSHLAFCGANLWGCVGVNTDSNYGLVKLGSLDEIGQDSQTWTYEDGMLKSNYNFTTSSWFNNHQHSYERCLTPLDFDEELVEGKIYRLSLDQCRKRSRKNRFVFEDGRVKSLASSSQVPFCVTIEGSVALQSAGSYISLQACDDSNDLQQNIQPYGNIEPFFATMHDDNRPLGYEDNLDLVYSNVTGGSSGSNTVLKIYHESDLEKPVYAKQVLTQSGFITINAIDFVGDKRGEFITAIGNNNEVFFEIIDRPHHWYWRDRCGGLVHDQTLERSTDALPIVLFSFLLILLVFVLYRISIAYMNRTAINGSVEDDDETVLSELDWKDNATGNEDNEARSHTAAENEESSSLDLEDGDDVMINGNTNQPSNPVDLGVNGAAIPNEELSNLDVEVFYKQN